jgi:hypothetical protein
LLFLGSNPCDLGFGGLVGTTSLNPIFNLTRTAVQTTALLTIVVRKLTTLASNRLAQQESRQHYIARKG